MNLGSRILRIVAVAAAVPLVSASSELDRAPIQYHVAEVRGKLTRELPLPEQRVSAGSDLASGAVLKTGWRSTATLTVAAAATSFAVGPRTRVRLAATRPGLLLEIEKGRLRALFEKYAGDAAPDRMVRTPSAVLAVRGTEYGVAVNRRGDTEVVVFAGEVSVREVGGREAPVNVGAGMTCSIPRGGPPSVPREHHMNPHAWDHGEMPHGMDGPGAGGMAGDGTTRHHGSAGSMRHGA